MAVFETVGFFVGACLLFYLGRLLARRAVRQAGDRPLVALVLATAVFHAANFAARLVRLVAGSRVWPLSNAAELSAFGALALLPPLLLHTHVALATRGDRRSRWRPYGIAVAYLPLVLLPAALAGVLTHPEVEALDALRGFEQPFLFWITAALLVSAAIDFALARRSPSADERRLFATIGWSFAANAFLFIATAIARSDPASASGRVLVSVSMLSSIAPALVFAYFIYRYNYLGLIVRRGALAALALGLVVLVFLILRAVSSAVQALVGVDARSVDAVLFFVFMIGVVLLAGRIRDVAFRLVFPDLSRQQVLMAQLGSSLGAMGSRRDLASHVSAALVRAFEFDGAALLYRGPDTDVPFACVDPGARALVRPEVSDPVLGGWMDERGLVALIPVTSGGSADLQALIAVGRSPRWPLMTQSDAAALVELGLRVGEALERVALVEKNIALDRRLQQEAHLAALGRLAATVAHEVKNPLGAIKTIAQVMREQEQDEARRTDLDMITSEVDRLAATVTQLLTFARAHQPGAGAGDAQATPVAALDTVVALFGPEAGRQGVTLEASFDPCPDPDRIRVPGLTTDHLTEILSNLVVNAIQAGAGRIRLTASLAEHDRLGHILRLTIDDDGAGIPIEVQPKVFDPFFTTRQRGTGLGLSIVQQRVRLAGGTVALESPPAGSSRGTRVIVEVPAVRVQ